MGPIAADSMQDNAKIYVSQKTNPWIHDLFVKYWKKKFAFSAVSMPLMT